MLIGMLSRLRKSSRQRVKWSLDLKIRHNRSIVKEILTHRKNDSAKINNLMTTNLSCKERRVIGSRRRTLVSGVSFIKYLGTTSMDVTPSNDYWPS
jgi:hypothetical protein